MLALLLFACATTLTRVGIVEVNGGTALRTTAGERWVLHLDAESEPLRFLDRCMVAVEGRRAGAGIRVQGWRVVDAGDGSGNFVGLLRLHGSRVVLDDRNSGAVLIVHDEHSQFLRPWVGMPVLLIGFQDGEGRIVPMDIRPLAEPRPIE